MKLRFWIKLLKDNRGQDMLEFALLCGLAASSGGFALPQIFTSFHQIYTQVGTGLTAAGGVDSSGASDTSTAAPPSSGHGDGDDH